ncbi:MAG TPA: hypothetical protein VHJ38_12950 [Nitrososphaeraceae archaeon]|nr:hypothetical protein [Nitrososphaeraceae archaeon]
MLADLYPCKIKDGGVTYVLKRFPIFTVKNLDAENIYNTINWNLSSILSCKDLGETII